MAKKSCRYFACKGAEVYRSRSVRVDSGRSLNDFRK